eukprot:2055318-Prorocentrum_lima.AAC.1
MSEATKSMSSMNTTSVSLTPSKLQPREAVSHRCLARLSALSRVVQKRAGAAVVPWMRPLERFMGAVSWESIRATTVCSLRRRATAPIQMGCRPSSRRASRMA